MKKPVLLGACISLSIIAILIPNQAKAAQGTPAPLAISTISRDCALQPAISRLDDGRYLAKPSKTDTRNKKLWAQPVSSSHIDQHFTSDLGRIANYVGSFDTNLKRHLRQACQLLDLPPPPRRLA